MKKLDFISLVLFLFTAYSIFAVPFRMIEVGDPLLEDYAFIIRSSEESMLSFTPPLSSDEILGNIKKLSSQNRSPAWKAAYDRIQRALSTNPVLLDSSLGITVHPELALEGRWRSNSEMDWIQPEPESPAVLNLPLQFFFANTVYARGDLIIRNDPMFYNVDESSLGTNLLLNIERIDLNMPLRAYISAGGPWWNVQLGRDKVSFGSGHTGNMALSDTPDYYDFLRFSLFSPNFKYSLFVTQMPLSTPDYFYADGFSNTSGSSIRSTTQRYLYLHRWDFRLWKRLSVGITEGVMVGNSPLELRFLNPLTVYHSFFSWNDYPQWGTKNGDMTGSLASLDLEWALGAGISLYGQMVMNQYQTPYELQNFTEEATKIPNGLGWLGGLQIDRDIAGWRSNFFLEGVYTDPYLYMLSSPFASFIWMRRLSAMIVKDLRYAWIGYPKGRDVISITFGTHLTRDPIALALKLEYENCGKHSLQWDWEESVSAAQQTTPTGIPEQSWTLASEVQWQVIKPLSLSLGSAVRYANNSDHSLNKQAFGIELGLKAKYIF